MPSSRRRPTAAASAAQPDAPGALDAYRKRRRASATPEPFDEAAEPPYSQAAGGRRLFVVQQHAATRLHWDFRLEVGSVLRSWAVPKGPSMDPQQKRFAVQVEDHPLEYADFEGRIPSGNYGAGQVLVWDQGTYVALEDFAAGFDAGKLLFVLNGHKLRGRFTLIRLKGRQNTGKEWLLIKEQDEWVDMAALPEDSVFSGLTMAAAADPAALADAFAGRIAALRPRPPATRGLIEAPMLASAAEPFRRRGWLFEVKYDGYRLLITRDGDQVRLTSRRGIDLTPRFPELVKCALSMVCDGLAIDGEVVVHDHRGAPRFGLLQERAAVRGEQATAVAARHNPVTFYAFALLHASGYDLKTQPLATRKRLLRELLPSRGLFRYSDHVDEDGVAAFEAMAELSLEGVVGKRADSPYRPGRSRDWLKVRANRTGDFVVLGWVPQKSNPGDVGALVLGEYRSGVLACCGRVGSGLGQGLRQEAQRRLQAAGSGPAQGAVPQAHWVQPTQVCEVEYREYSLDGNIRQPVFLRFRDDKPPAECVGAYREPLPPVPVPPSRREVPVTNRDKIFFPEKGLTKGDLLDYYQRAAPWMLPYLADRPLVLTRFPDGIHGKSFYQRDAPDFVPDWLVRKTLWSESAEREVRYFVVQNVESLVYLANMGAIPIHAWHSRITDLAHPDWCVLDLDPKDAPFSAVVATAKAVKALLDEVELPGFLKTSGASGLHILLPLAGTLTHHQATTLAELLSRVVVGRYPERCTIVRAVRRRDGKVYVDYLQNGHGQLLVAPLSARAEPAASVSMPVRWRELNGRLKNANYHLGNAVARLRRQGDPMAPVLATEPDIERALARLGELLGTAQAADVGQR